MVQPLDQPGPSLARIRLTCVCAVAGRSAVHRAGSRASPRPRAAVTSTSERPTRAGQPRALVIARQQLVWEEPRVLFVASAAVVGPAAAAQVTVTVDLDRTQRCGRCIRRHLRQNNRRDGCSAKSRTLHIGPSPLRTAQRRPDESFGHCTPRSLTGRHRLTYRRRRGVPTEALVDRRPRNSPQERNADAPPIRLTHNEEGPPCRRALLVSGGVPLSHTVSHAVPSALKGLTSGFGMDCALRQNHRTSSTHQLPTGWAHPRPSDLQARHSLIALRYGVVFWEPATGRETSTSSSDFGLNVQCVQAISTARSSTPHVTALPSPSTRSSTRPYTSKVENSSRGRLPA